MRQIKDINTTFWHTLLRNHPLPPRPLTVSATVTALWDSSGGWFVLLVTLPLLFGGGLILSQVDLTFTPAQAQNRGALVIGVLLCGFGVVWLGLLLSGVLLQYRAYRYGRLAQATIATMLLTGEAVTGRTVHRIYTVQMHIQAADLAFQTTETYHTPLRYPLEPGRVISVLLHPTKNEIVLRLDPERESKKGRRRRRKQEAKRRAG